MSSVITVKDMCLWYGQVQALKNININIEEKSITALIGPSGCGKSTFLKSLNRMNDLVPGVKITGDLRYRGEDIFDPKLNVNELRRNIGMVFQKPNPFPMSIYDNIAYGPRTHGITSRAKLANIPIWRCTKRTRRFAFAIFRRSRVKLSPAPHGLVWKAITSPITRDTPTFMS